MSRVFGRPDEDPARSDEELRLLVDELTALNGHLRETLRQQQRVIAGLQSALAAAASAIVLLDRDLNIQFFTPLSRRHFNLLPGDIGRPINDLAPRFSDPHLADDFRTAASDGLAVSREVSGDDGARYIRRILPHPGQGAPVEGIILAFTEGTAAEDERDADRALTESIVRHGAQPLLVLDSQMRILIASEAFCRLFALDPSLIAGRDFEEIAGGHFDVSSLTPFMEAARSGRDPGKDFEVAAVVVRGGSRSLHLAYWAIGGAPSDSRRILVALREVTGRTGPEDPLEIGSFEAGLSNAGRSDALIAAGQDLRQPLQTLTTLQGLLERTVEDPKATPLLIKSRRVLTSLADMLDRLLDFDRMETGPIRPEIRSCWINRLLERLAAEFKSEAETKGTALKYIPCSVSVKSDPRLLEQMIRNLISSAVRHTEQGRILVGCRRRGASLHIEVRDTGIGVAEERYKAVLENYRGEDLAAAPRPGLDPGLVFVKRLSELLDHDVYVRSESGGGNVFGLIVPVTAAPHGPLSALPPPAGVTRKTVLVVENDEELREALESLFEHEGYAAVAAADAEQALAMVEQGTLQPDILIAAYTLPQATTGAELAQDLRRLGFPDLPCMVLTSNTSPGALERLAGEDCVPLAKPVAVDELLAVTRQMLRGSGSVARRSAQRERMAGAESELTVSVVDDDWLLRESLHDLIEADGWRVEDYPSAEAFLEAGAHQRSGCLIIDLALPGMSGIALLKRLREEGNETPAIIVTGYGDVSSAVDAIRAGATDFLIKPARDDEIRTSIRRAIQPKSDVAEPSEEEEAIRRRYQQLSPREREVMDMVVEGLANKETAARLGISQRTVEHHRARILSKMEASSLADLVRMYLVAGLGEQPIDDSC